MHLTQINENYICYTDEDSYAVLLAKISENDANALENTHGRNNTRKNANIGRTKGARYANDLFGIDYDKTSNEEPMSILDELFRKDSGFDRRYNESVIGNKNNNRKFSTTNSDLFSYKEEQKQEIGELKLFIIF